MVPVSDRTNRKSTVTYRRIMVQPFGSDIKAMRPLFMHRRICAERPGPIVAYRTGISDCLAVSRSSGRKEYFVAILTCELIAVYPVEIGPLTLPGRKFLKFI